VCRWPPAAHYPHHLHHPQSLGPWLRRRSRPQLRAPAALLRLPPTRPQARAAASPCAPSSALFLSGPSGPSGRPWRPVRGHKTHLRAVTHIIALAGAARHMATIPLHTHAYSHPVAQEARAIRDKSGGDQGGIFILQKLLRLSRDAPLRSLRPCCCGSRASPGPPAAKRPSMHSSPRFAAIPQMLSSAIASFMAHCFGDPAATPWAAAKAQQLSRVMHPASPVAFPLSAWCKPSSLNAARFPFSSRAPHHRPLTTSPQRVSRHSRPYCPWPLLPLPLGALAVATNLPVPHLP